MDMTIYELKTIATEYHRGIVQIKPWCYGVAQGLGFDSVENIVLGEESFGFTAVWHGSYQSENREEYTFTYEDLLMTTNELVDAMDRKKRGEQDALEKERQAAKDEADWKLYRELYKRFGNRG